ncbi:hypothetical protein K8I61_19220 [bacterium]|nr:hypothetical protein [bacterium]
MDRYTTETGCCPILKSTDWEEREFLWSDNLFLKRRYRAFFHMPLNFGEIIRQAMGEIEKTRAMPEHPIALSCDETLFGGTLLISATRELPGWESVRLTGKFVTRLFEGRYSDTGRWIAAMKEYVARRGEAIDKLYTWYATCPNCATVYGAAQTVIIARVHPAKQAAA